MLSVLASGDILPTVIMLDPGSLTGPFEFPFDDYCLVRRLITLVVTVVCGIYGPRPLPKICC